MIILLRAQIALKYLQLPIMHPINASFLINTFINIRITSFWFKNKRIMDIVTHGQLFDI